MSSRATIHVATFAGIPILAHVSWLVALLLMTSSLSPALAPSAGSAAPLVALVSALLLSLSLVGHELGHALVARRRGVRVSSITLFVFGGVALLEREPRRPRDELAIAAAGPMVSIGIAAIAWAASHLSFPALVAEPLSWLARVNLGIAVFNLIPGFPLDGGRMLRAVLWGWSGNALAATLTAATAGRGIAYAMIAFGVARAFTGWAADGVWIGLVGWFLLSAASAALEGHVTGARVPYRRVAIEDEPLEDRARS